MKRNSVLGLRTLAIVALLALSACTDSENIPTTAEASPSVSILSSGVGAAAPPHEQIAQLLAMALQDDDLRVGLYHALAESRVSEGKIHLQTYLRGRGTALLAQMRREGQIAPTEMATLLTQAGSFEVYLPIDEHRETWRGGPNVIVGTYLDEEGSALGFELDGSPVMLSPKRAPATTTIAILPAEAFNADGVAYRDLAPASSGPSIQRADCYPDPETGECMDSGGGGGGGGWDPPPDPEPTWTGVWITYVSIGGDYDGWGDPEYVLFVDDVEVTEGSRQLACREEDKTVEPFRWNMNNSTYGKDFLVIEDGTIPVGRSLAFSIYEDDDTRCTRKEDEDFVKLAGDAIRLGQSGYKAFQDQDFAQAGMDVLNAAITAYDAVNGSDDFVGITSGNHNIDGVERRFNITNHNGNVTGWLNIVWKTDYANYSD